ncbi:MAG: hypothetical protein ACYDCJ_12585, partial [Gammaproteobacteria bacterium]
ERTYDMKRLTLAGLALAILALAACGSGGGSSGGGGYVPPPPPPATTYSASLRFVGPLDGVQIQSDLRQAQSVSPMSAATPLPIMIMSPIENGYIGGSIYVGTNQQGVVQAIVSPSPASTPTVTFSQTDASATIAPTPTPQPGITPPPLPAGVVAENGVASNGVDNVQASGVASAVIGSPVNKSPTTAIYQYMAVGVDCVSNRSSNPASSGPGWYYTGAGWAQTTDPTKADIYVTGSKCDGSYAVPNDNGTLNFPGGGTLISTDTPFSALSASQWANTETSVGMAALMLQNADGSINAELIAKTRDGLHTFKVFPNAVGGSAGDLDYEGAVEVSGAGVDGF